LLSRPARFIYQENGDSIADWVHQRASLVRADQLAGSGVFAKRGVTCRAGEDLQQPVVDLHSFVSREK
jgi:hypothetical protein